MKVLFTIAELQARLAKVDPAQTVGFVPTMGALHPGHISLIQRAIAENDLVAVSIFVNPLQFGKNEDLQAYPRQLEADRAICQDLGVDLLFAPSGEEMGVTGAETTLVVPPPKMASVLCGRYRQGHFLGVATIVTKLLNLVSPTTAYFGQKDAQQVAIIRKIARDLHLPGKIESCPIVRQDSGLAYSSRNQYLTSQQQEEAAAIFRSLQAAKRAFQSGERNADKLISLVRGELPADSPLQLQYVEIVEPETLEPLREIKDSGLLAIACHLGATRLIDNIILTARRPIIAIDGPAGAGKSTISRRVAHSLGLLYLDTGAMYRAITWLTIQSGIEPEDREAIAALVKNAQLELSPPPNLDGPVTVKINLQDVTEAIRTPEVTAKVSSVAAQGAVRAKLVGIQKQWGEKGGIVAEGRDIGTNVFPDADLKIFLTASAAERARRRSQDLCNQGETEIDLAQLERDIAQRDRLDSTRALAPLKKAPDAIEIDTDGLSVQQVTDRIISLVEKTGG